MLDKSLLITKAVFFWWTILFKETHMHRVVIDSWIWQRQNWLNNQILGKKGGGWKGSIAHNSSAPSCPGLESEHPQIFPDEKMVDVAEGYQWWCLEESRQWLENVTQPNLVLASGKLVPQKGWVGAVVVAQLAEWSLPTPEICGSNPNIGKN